MDNSHKTILHLCADIGSDSQPYREAGYNVICVGKNISVENYHPPENVYGIIANPPCTMFSIARTTAKTPRDLEEGMIAVKHCLRIIWECIYKQYNEHSRKMPITFWVIENPGSGYLRWFLGQPKFEYCPSWYGETFTKRTALWGQFNIPHIPFMEKPLIDGVRSLGGDYGRNKHLCWTRDGGGGRQFVIPSLPKHFSRSINNAPPLPPMPQKEKMLRQTDTILRSWIFPL